MEFLTTQPGNDPIVMKGYFAAKPAKVFQAWTDPNIVMKWFGRTPNSLYSATIDLRLGGAWKFLKSKDEQKAIGFEGEYLEIEPDKHLAFSWSQIVEHANGQREATPHSRVEIVLSVKGKGTSVCLTHSVIHSEETCKGFAGGWEVALNCMRNLFSNS